MGTILCYILLFCLPLSLRAANECLPNTLPMASYSSICKLDSPFSPSPVTGVTSSPAPLAIHGSYPRSSPQAQILISESLILQDEFLTCVPCEMKGTRCLHPSRMLSLLGIWSSEGSPCWWGAVLPKGQTFMTFSCISRALKPIYSGESWVYDFQSKSHYWRFYSL